MIVGIYGILKAGGAYVPMSITYPENRINYIIKDSNIKVVLTTSNLLKGKKIDGLIYDPESTSITNIGTWLINGPYHDKNIFTRLLTDYIDGEEFVEPSIGDTTINGEWKRGIGDGYPFDLGYYFDKGDWVLSDDIQKNDMDRP